MSFSISSGVKTTSGLIRAGKAQITGVLVMTDDNSPMQDCTVTIYDSATAASGDVLFQVTIPAATVYDYFDLPCIKADTGLWLSLSTTRTSPDTSPISFPADGQVIVYYK